jgi:hypothetical protein
VWVQRIDGRAKWEPSLVSERNMSPVAGREKAGFVLRFGAVRFLRPGGQCQFPKLT